MSAQILTALPVDMSNFKRLIVNLSPEYSLCVRGRHAIGKSEGVYQAATEMRSDFYKSVENCARMIEAFGGKVKTPTGWVTSWSFEAGIPVLERRLSQMTEGDIIGLPTFHGKDTFDEKTGQRLTSSSTQFRPCDWLINSTEFPVVLFLDERNRALDGVKQAVFQLTDSKAFYGHHLHEETHIVIAENDGDDYQIQQCDPAELSRCATVILTPTVRDWLNYANDHCNDATIEFIRQNEALLEHNGTFEPNKKYPDRRSWFKLDQELTRLDLFANPTDHLFYVLAGSFVGIEAASKFNKFVQERNREVTIEDILENWPKAKKRLANKNTVTAEQYVECVSKFESWLKNNKDKVLTYEQAEQLSKFMQDSPAEVLMTCWTSLQVNTKNLVLVHRFVKELILAAATGNEDLKSIKLPTAEDLRKKDLELNKSSGTEEVVPAKKRGAKQKT